MDRQLLTEMIDAEMSLEAIAARVERHPSTVAYWLRRHGLRAVHAERHRARGPIDRTSLARMVDRGMSISELAVACDRSKSTVRHWLRRYELTTLQAARQAQRRALVAEALAHGTEPPATVTMQCRSHGEAPFVREGSGYYRCARCRSESVAEHRRRLKATLVAEAGGRCVICGYNRQPRALQFHHLDPAEKRFALSRRGVTLSLSALRAEARKCVLLCANCHAEVEDGAVTVPVHCVTALSPEPTRRPDPG